MYWYFRYPAADGGEGVVVATSRPETMFGDVAIAVHPDDERYKDHGRQERDPSAGRPGDPGDQPTRIRIQRRGRVLLRSRLAHDPNDFEVGQRHDLENLILHRL